MPKFIVLSPEGTTEAPTELLLENFQVLAFVTADTAGEVITKIQTEEEYKYIHEGKFDETWVYELAASAPAIITNMICEDHPVVKALMGILSKNYSEVDFDYSSDDTYHFEGFSDAEVEIKVEVNDEQAKIYDRYITDKHYTFLKEAPLTA